MDQDPKAQIRNPEGQVITGQDPETTWIFSWPLKKLFCQTVRKSKNS